jgi:hypothetical protein
VSRPAGVAQAAQVAIPGDGLHYNAVTASGQR